jgi:alginate O-acetyltransferase complex protein AlgI
MVWRPIYGLLIAGSTIVDYIISIQMSKSKSASIRRIYLITSLLVNLGVLFIFKYLGLFVETINSFTEGNYDAISLLLPMGISFYTFQTLSYTIDVYRKQREPENHLGYFALYVTFFPQLVAGPIERSDRLIPQLRKENFFEYTRTTEAIRRIVWGFFKKLVIADNLAVSINLVYGNYEKMSGLTLLIATIFFSFQIYCDFSGYTDIAIGSAKILGIDLMENFNRPYFSTSIREFWSRWHISLSTWFRDYIYVPLGGSRKGLIRTYINILVVFLISGLWHGASWMFVLWGLIHGLYQIYEKSTHGLRDRLWRVVKLEGTWFQSFVKWIITMTVVLFSWVFFRSETLNDAIIIVNRIFISFQGFSDLTMLEIYQNVRSLGINLERIIIIILSITALIFIESESKIYLFLRGIFYKRKLFRVLIYYLILLIIIIGGNYGQNEFIYFQF